MVGYFEIGPINLRKWTRFGCDVTVISFPWFVGEQQPELVRFLLYCSHKLSWKFSCETTKLKVHGNTNNTIYATLFVLLLSEYDVIDLSEIRGLLLKSTESPGRFCKTGHFAMFEALYLRLTESVFIPVKNGVFLMLRTFTRFSILNHRSFPLRISEAQKILSDSYQKSVYLSYH